MNRKIFIVVFFFLIILILPCVASEVVGPVAHYIMGYVESNMSIAVSLDDEVVPFDLESPSVKYDSGWNSKVTGLNVGTYTLISNVSFELYVAHTPFELKRPSGNDDGTLEEIDYVLYLINDFANATYGKCRSATTAAASSPDTINDSGKRILISGQASLTNICKKINNSIFVMLYDTSGTSVSRLKSGGYESTIYFLLKGQ